MNITKKQIKRRLIKLQNSMRDKKKGKIAWLDWKTRERIGVKNG